MFVLLMLITSIFGGWLLTSLFNPSCLYDYGMQSYLFLIGVYAVIIFIVLLGMIKDGEEESK